MQRVLVLVIACALGLGAALLFNSLAPYLRPCSGERLACSMDGILGMIASCAAAGLALVLFGIALFWKGNVRAITTAMLATLVPLLAVWAFVTISKIQVREFHEIRESDIREVFQVVIPVILAAVIPWLVLLAYIRRARSQDIARREMHG